jgi:hypothetical protein
VPTDSLPPPVELSSRAPTLLGFASRTGTRRNLEALRTCGWGLLVSAKGVLRTEGFATYALDNGAWTAFRTGRPFDEAAFVAAVDALGARAQFVVVPDIVCGGLESLRFSEAWLPRLAGIGRRRLLAVQNGMVPADVRPFLSSEVGLFVGGDTAWKESSLPLWGELARERGCYLHVGRVNSARRIRLCQLAGAHSFDGTSVSRFAQTIGLLDSARRQAVLDFHRPSSEITVPTFSFQTQLLPR